MVFILEVYMQSADVFELYVKNREKILMQKYIKKTIGTKEVNDFNWKHLHSQRVSKLCQSIAISEGLDDNIVLLASIAGLFHDIGRFNQILEYQTENDQKSKDHGLIGYEILKMGNLLAKTTLTNQEKEIVYQSTLYHNKYHSIISDNDLTNLICQIVRDADKIDILKGMIYGNIPFNNNSTELSVCALTDFHNHQLVNAINVKTPNDYILKALSFGFDINTYTATKQILDNDLFNKLLKDLKYPEIFQAACNEVNDYLENKYLEKRSTNVR
jgi:HD superfamily phosphohydrolase YqeK